jgi:hypothetical protein
MPYTRTLPYQNQKRIAKEIAKEMERIFRRSANGQNSEVEEKLIINGKIDFLAAGNGGQGFKSLWVHCHD